MMALKSWIELVVTVVCGNLLIIPITIWVMNWMQSHEEEDVVRFRQRCIFAILTFCACGYHHLKNCDFSWRRALFE